VEHADDRGVEQKRKQQAECQILHHHQIREDERARDDRQDQWRR
jgi:hypothetical protein